MRKEIIQQVVESKLTNFNYQNINESFFEDLLHKSNSIYAHLMYSYFLIKNEKYSQSERVYNDIKNINISDSYNLSLFLMIEGLISYYFYEKNEGLNKLLESSNIDNSNKWAKLELFFAYRDSDPYIAWGYLEDAIKIDNKFNEAIYERVLYYDPVDNCGDIIREILTITPSYLNVHILNTLAYAYYNAFEVSNALTTIKQSLELEITDRALYLKGIINHDEMNYIDALKYFNKSLDLNLHQKDVLISKGWLLYDMDRIDEAEDVFLSVYSIDKDQLVYNQLIQFYLKIKNYSKALFYIEESIQNNGKNHMNEAYFIIYKSFKEDSRTVNSLIYDYRNSYLEEEVSWFLDVYDEYGGNFPH